MPPLVNQPRPEDLIEPRTVCDLQRAPEQSLGDAAELLHGTVPARVSRRDSRLQSLLATADVTDSAGFIKLFGLQLRGSKRITPMDVEQVQTVNGGWSKK